MEVTNMAGQIALVKMRDFYEYDANRFGRELAHGRLNIVLKELRKHLGTNIDKQKVLDIGVSDGYLIEKIRDIGAIPYGIDIALSVLKLVPKERPVFLIQGSVTHLPFVDDFFNMITACEILEHLDEYSLTEALKELYRVLAPRGYLLATTPYNEEISNSYTKSPECKHVFPPSGHYCSFNEDKWRSFITVDIGFSYINIKKIYGTDFCLKRLSFCTPFIKMAARLFSVDSLTKMLVIIRK